MKKIVLEHSTKPINISFISGGYEEGDSTQSVGPLKKNYAILHFVTSGRGHYYLGNRHFVIEQGQLFYTPENTSIFYHADTVNPWSYSWICFNGADAIKILTNCGLTEETPILSLKSIPEIQYIILKMLNHFQIKPANEWFIQSAIIRIFALIQSENNQEYERIDVVENPLLIDAIKQCQSADLRFLSVTNLCSRLHISRTYLFMLFKEQLGISPQQFITGAKISNSRELLAKTDIPIHEIAGICGYKNPFAFSRAFKREISLTPTEYRQLYLRPSELLDY